MLLDEVGRVAVGFGVENEIDAALAVEGNVFGTMPRHGFEADLVKNGFEQFRLGCGKLDEFESIEPHRVIEQFGYGELRVIALIPIFCPFISKNVS